MSLRHTAASGQQPAGHTPAPIVSLTTVIAAGLTSATIAVITSYFGWPGTLLGVAFSAMVTTTTSEVYKSYLNSVVRKVVPLVDRPTPPPLGPLAGRPPPPPLGPLADRPPPPPLGPTSRARRLPGRIRALAALRWFSFRTSPEMRRSILSSGLQVGVLASIIGLGIVTGSELELGGNLPCAIWNTDCSPEGINPPSILAPFYTICQG
jgi:hypothetical protein